MISPEAYLKDTTEVKVLSPQEYIGDKSIPEVLTPKQIEKGLTKPKMEERSFIAKHPNLYGVFGMVQELVPYIKYIDPTERERFSKLSTQKQTRELLLQNLEAVLMVGAPLITKGAVPIVAKYLPRTYKAAKFIKTPIKEWGELLNTAPKEVAGKALAEGQNLVANKIAVYKNVTGEHPTSGLITQWWKDTALAIKPKVIPSSGATGTEAIEAKAITPVDKITQAIKEAKPIRKKQEQLYTEERGKRIKEVMAIGEGVPGEAGYHAQLGKLKGEMPKVDFESIRGKVGQDDIDELFNIVNQSVDVTGFDNITAKRGLAKLLGEAGVAVPQESELAQLRKIFPADFVDTLLKKRTSWQKIKEAGGQLFNIPRSIMSSFDLSAPLRQGLFIGPSHPKRFMQSFGKMFKLFPSEKAFAALQESIAQKPTYGLMKESGLSLMEMGSSMAKREEIFMSQWAEKIPVIGRGVRASGRAYVGFLNKLRADVFEDLVNKAQKLGLDPSNNMDLVQGIANFVNAGTGRGGLGALENAAVGLNAAFFSPRLMASRLTLLNPIYYVKQDPFVRKEALQSLFTLAGTIGTTLGIARAGGLKVGTDVRSADFGKIKVGNTRIDIMGGFQQYIRAAGQLISGEYVSSTTGKVMTLGEGYRPLTRWEILVRQAETKTAPVLSFIIAMLKGKDIAGKDISVPKEVGSRFVPMVMQDVYDLAKDDPDLVPLASLGIFGVGLQTYKNTQRSSGGLGGLKGLEKLEQ